MSPVNGVYKKTTKRRGNKIKPSPKSPPASLMSLHPRAPVFPALTVPSVRHLVVDVLGVMIPALAFPAPTVPGVRCPDVDVLGVIASRLFPVPTGVCRPGVNVLVSWHPASQRYRRPPSWPPLLSVSHNLSLSVVPLQPVSLQIKRVTCAPCAT